MAGLCRLKLSALKNDLTYPMTNNVPSGRCLIHVKLTDFCVKTIENLMDSEKGAFFTLFFEENGGNMSIPVDRGDSKVFQFKTAPLHEGEGQGSLECVHQEMGAPPTKEHSLSCWGVMEHRLTVQGTDEVYARTKKQMEIAVERRKEQRAQEIQVVPQGGGRTKVKSHGVEKVSTFSGITVRKHNRSRAPVTGSSKISSLTATRNTVAAPSNKFMHQTPPKPAATTITTTTSASTTATSLGSSSPAPPPAPPTELKVSHKSGGRNTYSLKHRIIYMLAAKPQNRETIVSKLKKATKRSENAMTNLDSILEEVSEQSQGLYSLKPHYFSSIDVDQWPFYTEAQKQMLKRMIQTRSYVSEVTSSSSTNMEDLASVPGKRACSELVPEALPKKPKLSESSPPEPSPPLMDVGPMAPEPSPLMDVGPMAPEDSLSSNMGKDSPHHLTSSTVTMPTSPIYLPEHSEAENNISSRKHKKKKKKKKKEEDSDMIAPDPTSTSHTPEYLSQFPPLSSDEERHRYKHTFNREYEEYLQLKSSIDHVSSTYQTVCSALSERLNSVPKHSDEYKETKRSIQEKYREFQCNRSYIDNKNRFDELHQKLAHIKQMVLDYDSRQR